MGGEYHKKSFQVDGMRPVMVCRQATSSLKQAFRVPRSSAVSGGAFAVRILS